MIFQLKFWEQKEEEPKQEKKPEQTFDQFLKTAEAKKFTEDWKKKGYTKRGVSKLLQILWPIHNEKKGVLKAAEDILASLKCEDALGKILSALKLAPEGIMKVIKA